jgi:hypothetical protein
LAEHISRARYLEFAGIDHMPFVGDNVTEIADAIQEFLTGSRAVVPVDRVLATVLFTDIVGSTEKAAELGDRGLDLTTAIAREIAADRGVMIVEKIAPAAFDCRISGPMNNQRRHPDGRENTPDVDLAVHAHECGSGGWGSTTPARPTRTD